MKQVSAWGKNKLDSFSKKAKDTFWETIQLYVFMTRVLKNLLGMLLAHKHIEKDWEKDT